MHARAYTLAFASSHISRSICVSIGMRAGIQAKPWLFPHFVLALSTRPEVCTFGSFFHGLRIHLGAGVHARPAHSALFLRSSHARRCCFRHVTLIAKDRACVRPDPMVLRPQVMAALLRALSTSALQGIVQREPDCCCISLRNTSHGVKIGRCNGDGTVICRQPFAYKQGFTLSI